MAKKENEFQGLTVYEGLNKFRIEEVKVLVLDENLTPKSVDEILYEVADNIIIKSESNYIDNLLTDVIFYIDSKQKKQGDVK